MRRTWRLHIRGQVQGVGFRPFIYNLANELHIKGNVSNTKNGVNIIFNANDKLAEKFFRRVLRDRPGRARLQGHSLIEEPKTEFPDFQITKSEEQDQFEILATPDFAICSECEKDITQLDNRRHNYAFTTCTQCGPRYSIINQLPYDRELTTMDAFQMCPTCEMEYNEPKNRRYYSQTNSCPECGIKMQLFDSGGEYLSQEASSVIANIRSAWAAGKIVAIQGIGGFLLTCDASNEKTIAVLRQRKKRPSKPFAVMYKNLEGLRQYHMSDQEKIELSSPVSPIVLLEKKDNLVLPNNIAPNLKTVGVVLAYTPLYHILLSNYTKPIVATSCNLNREPIIYQSQKDEKLFQLADLVLSNNRTIVTPQDDSVIRYAKKSQSRIVIRRSRGIAPSFNFHKDLADENVLATGAMLKSTFSIQYNKILFTSQYLGDLESYESEANYKYTIQHLCELYSFSPDRILADIHDEYPSTRIAKEYAEQNQARIQYIQHHKAHFAAVIGENDLIDTQEPIFGIIWDGTGLGEDQNIWGGEFFLYENYKIERVSHFSYFPAILGNKMPKEPRVSALSLTHDLPKAEKIMSCKFTVQEWSIYNQILSKENSLLTSSVGRLFDAVASLLQVGDYQTYEGESAGILEQMAREYFECNGYEWISGGNYSQMNTISSQQIIDGIVSDILKREDCAFIAAKFHITLIDIIHSQAKQLNIRNIALSGGVFQNALLVDLALRLLSSDYNIFLHKELSPNDENISYGQIMYYHIEQKRRANSVVDKQSQIVQSSMDIN